jgi:DNA polymerase V
LIPERGETLLVRIDGRTEFVKLMGKAPIADGGEAIEGDGLDDASVYGVVTHFVNKVGQDNGPII